jgi:hypothetical protein
LAHFEVFTHAKARIVEYMKRMKNLHTTVCYFGGNSLKVKTRKVPSKRPVQNWYFRVMGMMENFQGGTTCDKTKY